MRKVNNIIKNTVISFIMAVLPVSCLLEKDGPSVEREGVMIEMNVSAGDVTRALPEEDPTSVEKVIKTLRVYAFYGEALAGYTFRGETVVGESFYMDLNLPKSGVCDVEFFLIANEANDEGSAQGYQVYRSCKKDIYSYVLQSDRADRC